MKENQKNKFKTPEGYFERFNERLMDRIAKDSDSHQNIIPESDGFAVPDGYFENLPSKIASRIENGEGKVVQLNPQKKFYYAAAAIAAIIALALALNIERSTEIEFDDLASSDIADYFENTNFNLTTNEIAELLPIENIAISDITEVPLGEENILEYLDENIEDLDELNLDYNELE
ncbi:hypothetical protein [Allomuricauda sp. SCSIO 65647]|uniref:hypothetical protein n=1 Tax=Allomuricauda sp. SCSIO 65647 TaxID=2908843 RepID=UPI001F164BCA|nr:hypothetical protein [Muricauda sp. SCSIO 65647]UJH67705.1 hypothetical protein L0P89_00455 [Muricauda sp. SCSIO 65647]